jgi:hypothetical protein
VHTTEARLDRIRGSAAPRPHTARTLAALTSNPGCARRAIMDAAGVDKALVAAHAGFRAPFGQSQFAITRGNAFEAQVKADGCAELLRLLREQLRLPIPEVSYDDLEYFGGEKRGPQARHARTRTLLGRAAASGDDAGTMFDHPMLTLEVGGRLVYLEPDLIAFRLRDRFHVVEIKSFAVIDGQADGGKVAAAVIQSAVYVLALRQLMEATGAASPDIVADEVILVCPENFSNRPVGALLDVRKQLTVLRRQLARLERIEDLLDALPADLTFDLAADENGVPRRPPGELAEAIREVPARYAPECLASCEMCYFCRDEARGETGALGRDVRDELGCVEYVPMALALARGEAVPAPDLAEAAAVLRLASRLRSESLPGRAGPPPAPGPWPGAAALGEAV